MRGTVTGAITGIECKAAGRSLNIAVATITGYSSGIRRPQPVCVSDRIFNEWRDCRDGPQPIWTAFATPVCRPPELRRIGQQWGSKNHPTGYNGVASGILTVDRHCRRSVYKHGHLMGRQGLGHQ